MKIGEIDMKKIIVGSTLILGISLLLIGYLYQNRLDMEKQNRLAKEKALEENILKKKIKEAYHEKVVTNKDTNLYKLENNKYYKSGKVLKDIIFYLDNNDKLDGYYKIKNSNYYLYYTDFIESNNSIDNRYLNYVYFPLEITIKKNSSFYDSNNKELFNLKDSIKLQVL